MGKKKDLNEWFYRLVFKPSLSLTLTVLRADLNGPNFTYAGVLLALHIGPNFDVKNKLSIFMKF